MPTPSEQKALAFVAIVILLGGAVRVLRAGAAIGPTEFEQQALANQATAADKAVARSMERVKKSSKHAQLTHKTRDTVAKVVAGVAMIPPVFARPNQPSSHAPYGSPTSMLGFPPPGPRIDVDYRIPRPHGGSTIEEDRAAHLRVDLDVANEAEIDRLPRVGPATARRIVANRDTFGPFKSLDGLRRVRGLGPALLQRLGEFITFSGAAPPRAEH